MTKENLCGIIFRYESTLAALAQLDRVFGYEPKGRGFESLTPCQEKHRGYFLGAFLLYDDTMKNPAILLFAKLQRLRCGERAVIDFSTANAGSESLTPCRAAEHLSPTPSHTPCHFVTSPLHPRGGGNTTHRIYVLNRKFNKKRRGGYQPPAFYIENLYNSRISYNAPNIRLSSKIDFRWSWVFNL